MGENNQCEVLVRIVYLMTFIGITFFLFYMFINMIIPYKQEKTDVEKTKKKL